ncbi:MAG: tyrosine recombinase XerC [Tissierellia bacterium]|nr:tyrosine recombinase XerC [Tissierellia bacterium]
MKGIPAIFEDYLSYLESTRELSPATVQVYFYETRLFLRYIKYRFNMLEENESIEFPDTIDISSIDENVLSKVRLRDLLAYIGYADKTLDNSSAAKARKVSSLRTFFNYLNLKAEVIDKNPTDGLDLPKKSTTLPKYLSLDQSMQLINTIKAEEDLYVRTRDLAIIMLFLNTGMRVAELCALNIENYNRENLSIRVTGKGNKQREIFLHLSTANLIDDYIAIRPDVENENAIFISRKLNRYSTRGIQYLVERYVDKAGLDSTEVTVHKLRHTAATFMYLYGDSDIRSIQEILGHANISTTQIYTHVSEDKKRAIMENFPLGDIE